MLRDNFEDLLSSCEYNTKLNYKEILWGKVDVIQLAPEGTIGWLS
jgi:hypothetical protein